MGIIIGKFRKKKSTYEVLEKLENEIISIEEFGRSTEQFRKKVIARFILLAVLIYCILTCVLYLYYNKISPNQKLIYIVPLVTFPFIIFIIKKFLAWYYTKKLQRNERKLVKLKEEKKKMLDNVMETETYKVAKKILDKFGNEGKKNVPDMSLATSLMVRTNQTGLRQRNAPTARLSFGSPKTPMFGEKPFAESTSMMYDKPFGQPTPLMAPTRAVLPATPKLGPVSPKTVAIAKTPLPMPRSILPSNRSILDKMVDYLVGDGPSNRYALICKKCSFHNGMAVKEEFEYLSFRCCYCGHFNPARKKKPSGPKFEASESLKLTQIEDSSESDKDTQDSETETKEPLLQFDLRRSSSDVEVSRPLSIEARSMSESQVFKPIVERENSSPEIEKYSDFDKLSDLESREGDISGKSPDDSGISPESVVSTNQLSEPVDGEEAPASPMEIDDEKSTTELKDINES